MEEYFKEKYFKFVPPPEPNFTLAFDSMNSGRNSELLFKFYVKKTLKARIKYWLFCKFFPFKVTRWDE